MVLNLESIDDSKVDVHQLASRLIDKFIWVNWPHLTYAKVTGIGSVMVKYFKNQYNGFIEKG